MNSRNLVPLLGLVVAATFCSGQTQTTQRPPQKQEQQRPETPRGELSLSSRSADEITGRYVQQGVELRFALSLPPREGRGRGVMRLQRPDGFVLVQQVYDFNGTISDLRVMGDRLVLNQRLLDDGQEELSYKGDPRALNEFLETREARLLPGLSRELGEGREKITGQEFPVSLPLHLLAMRVARLRTPARAAAAREDAGVRVPLAESPLLLKASLAAPSQSCTDVRTTACPDCFGMCGNGCNCWQWVCGDCCCNKGCQSHDAAGDACIASGWRNIFACARYITGDLGVPLFRCRKCSLTCPSASADGGAVDPALLVTAACAVVQQNPAGPQRRRQVP